jgi:hypothetical protein
MGVPKPHPHAVLKVKQGIDALHKALSAFTSIAVLVAAMMFVAVSSSQAEQMQLRCDPFPEQPNMWVDPPSVLIVKIDTDKLQVHVGDDDNDGWYADGRRVENSDESFPGEVKCYFTVTQFVRITAKGIEFGANFAIIPGCRSSEAHNSSLTQSISEHGIASIREGRSYHRYQCHRLQRILGPP